jgi:predicted DNA-binding protein (MmcQ/YjbR family)
VQLRKPQQPPHSKNKAGPTQKLNPDHHSTDAIQFFSQRNGELAADMDIDKIRTCLLAFPHVVETEQFGGLVFWVGDKAIGGKMFAWIRLEHSGSKPRVISYLAGPERYHELLEIDGIFPAPYVARIFWVAIERWNVFRTAEWEKELRAAHTLTFNKLPPVTRTVLALPAADQRRALAERKKLLASKQGQKTTKRHRQKE